MINKIIIEEKMVMLDCERKEGTVFVFGRLEKPTFYIRLKCVFYGWSLWAPCNIS